MQLDTKELRDALALLGQVIPAKSSNPDLAALTFEATESGLRLSGQNYDVTLHVALGAKVDEPRKCYLPGAQFQATVAKAPGETVDLAFEDGVLRVRSGPFKAALQLLGDGISTLEFPDAEAEPIDGDALAAAIRNVAYATAKAEYQPVFRGVYFDERGDVVATDGYRLALQRLDHGLSCILPRAGADLLGRVLAGPSRAVIHERRLWVETGGVQAGFALLDGHYPDYERVIPSQFPGTVTVDGGALADTVERVAVMAEKAANNRVDLTPQGDRLIVTAVGNYGEASEEVEATLTGTVPPLAFNAGYLLDALKPLTGAVTLKASGAVTPVVLVSDSEPTHLATIVPLRLA